jgi:hypothetical protein
VDEVNHKNGLNAAGSIAIAATAKVSRNLPPSLRPEQRRATGRTRLQSPWRRKELQSWAAVTKNNEIPCPAKKEGDAPNIDCASGNYVARANPNSLLTVRAS